MINKEYDILHKELQQLIKVLEKRNKIEENRNRILKSYANFSDERMMDYLDNKKE